MSTKSLFLLFVIVFLIYSGKSEAQTLELKRVLTMEAPVAASADGQGNLYLSTKGGEINKFSSTGILLGTFSPQMAGRFNVIDASSALQIRAFNENSQTMVYLDRFLNQTASFELSPERFAFVKALCWSAGNTAWLVDATEMELSRWRIDTREVVRNINLNQFITDKSFDIRSLQEHQHKLYLFSSNTLFVFDQMGNYEQQASLPQWKSIAFTKNNIMLLGENSLFLMDLGGLEKSILPLPERNIYEQLCFSKGEIYLFSAKETHVYGVNP